MGSHFEPSKRISPILPCVIYLHGNSSNRLEALPCIEMLLPLNITLFCFDFSGCGLSEGEYISLGYFERDDVSFVIDYLRSTKTVSSIGLWGRSMGAVTAIMHSIRDPSIAGMVLDSPFTSLRTLAEELCKSHTKIPKTILDAALKMIRKTILQKAGFDILELEPIKYVKKAFIPAFFIAGKNDNFIKPHHSQQLHDSYSGDKNIVLVEGDHNDDRPEFLMNSIAIFFYNSLQCELLLGKAINLQKDKKESSSEKFYKKKEGNIGNEQDVQKAFRELDSKKEVLEKKEKQESKNEDGFRKKNEKKPEIEKKEIIQNQNDEEIWNKLQFLEFSKEEVEWNNKMDKEITELLENVDLLGLNGEETKNNKEGKEKNEKKNIVVPPIKSDDLLSLGENDKSNKKEGLNLLDIDFFYEGTNKGNK